MIDTTLAGHYQVVRHLGGGSFGQTFLAKDKHLPGAPLFVIKQLKPKVEDAETLEIAKRLFNREAETLYKLGNHDRIPRLMAHFEQDGEFYLVQEYIEGRSLETEIRPGKQWSETDVVVLLRNTLEVLAFIHQQNVIHRDIKPANLIERAKDNKIVLIDFGAVKEISSQTADKLGQRSDETIAIGTLDYMPNEQIAGHPQFASDIYAVGMMCLQALTGLIPKDLPRDARTNEYSCALCGDRAKIRISQGLAAILDNMVRYDYRQRYEDATVALQDLEQINNAIEPTIISSMLPLVPADSQKNESLTLEEPDGQVRLNSPFYMERSPIESDCFEAVMGAGALIRVKAPRQMGKSSLLSRILFHAQQQGYKSVHLYFQQADGEVFADLDRFLQWFCASIASELDLDNKLDEYWTGVLGSKNKCSKYFQRYLLAEITVPLVLGLDEVDLMFQYPKIATDFFGLLRAWHEKSKNEEIWKRLRLVIVHSKEVYIPLNINQSPFNVGLPIELPELTQPQVEDLVKRHELIWTQTQVEQLMALVGGHPYLVRQALYQIARGRITLEQLLQIAQTEVGIYGDHLRRHLANLEEDHELVNIYKQIVVADAPMRIETALAFRLHSMGLVKFQGNEVTPMCNLYRHYFREWLG
jgi:serine/threonine protein kinase